MGVVVAVLSGAACVPYGGLYNGVRYPGQFTSGSSEEPGGSAIQGESCAHSILGLVAFGDYSVDNALKAAGGQGETLKNVAVDVSVRNYLWVYQRFCTTVNAQIAI